MRERGKGSQLSGLPDPVYTRIWSINLAKRIYHKPYDIFMLMQHCLDSRPWRLQSTHPPARFYYLLNVALSPPLNDCRMFTDLSP